MDEAIQETQITNPSRKLKPQNPISDSHTVPITTIRLNGDNFLCWSQSVRMSIRGRGKMSYFIGKRMLQQPQTNHLLLEVKKI
jgi:hypothetical protein